MLQVLSSWADLFLNSGTREERSRRKGTALQGGMRSGEMSRGIEISMEDNSAW